MNSRKPIGIFLVILIIIIAAGYVLLRGKTEEPLMPETASREERAPAALVVKTPAAKRAETAYTETRKMENGRYVTTVILSNAGFAPHIVTVNRGENIRFVNESSGVMRIASNEFQGVPLLSSLNQEKSVGANGAYEVALTEVGVWGYRNGIGTATTPTGIIHVK